MSLDLSQLVSQYGWFHSIDLGGGVVTPGVKTLDIHKAEYSAFFDPVDLRGRTLVDIGAWDGAYSFEAKRRGASRVLATDHFMWEGATWNVKTGRKPFDLACSVLNLDVEALNIDVHELSPQRVGTFDAVLLLGVFYHLFDPIAGLANVAKLAREVLVVETHTELLDTDRPAMVFFPGSELNGDATNWWGPNPELMIALLKSLGFAKVDATWSIKERSRAVFHAWRTESMRRFEGGEQRISSEEFRKFLKGRKHLSSMQRMRKKLASLYTSAANRSGT